MREIKYIVLHCTATQPTATIEGIMRYWFEEKGWKSPGYHYMIKASGETVSTYPIDKISNGVKGYNKNSIHISYIGGIDKKGKPQDTRTQKQIGAQIAILGILKKEFPNAAVVGHRDFPNVAKACPSFDVKTWLESIALGHWFKKVTA